MSGDSLINIFECIKTYHEELGYPRDNNDLNDILLALHTEVFEVQECFNWKPWKKDQGTLKPAENLADELADIIFFIGSVMELAKVDPKEITKALWNKLDKNYKRIRDNGDHVKRK